jgi:hypothetical protein
LKYIAAYLEKQSKSAIQEADISVGMVKALIQGMEASGMRPKENTRVIPFKSGTNRKDSGFYSSNCGGGYQIFPAPKSFHPGY